MTLLVLDIRLPAAETIHRETELWRALVVLSPRLLMYVMSFMTLGSSGWAADPTESSGALYPQPTWIHLVFRFTVTMMPCPPRCWHSTRLPERAADLLGQSAGCRSEPLLQLELRGRKRSCEGRYAPQVSAAIQRRIVIRTGFVRHRRLLLCAEYLLEHRLHRLIQLNYAFALRLPGRGRQ